MTTLWCRSCRRLLEPGAALRVVDRHSGETFVVCRPSINPRCFGYCGQRSRTTIAMFDIAAADRWDLQ